MTLDTVLPERRIADIVSVIFKNNGTKPVIEIEAGSNIGEGFLGITAAVTAKLDNEAKHFFIKMAVQDPELREVTFQKEVFNKEACFYSKIYPIFDDLCLKYSKTQFDVTPRCVYSSVEDLNECVVLENLTRKNYKLKGGKESFDKEHLLIVLRAYSRFHACGFILKKENPDFFEKLLAESKTNFFISFAKMYGFDKLAARYLDILKDNCSLDQDKDILINLETIRNDVLKSLDAMENVEDYCTIIHTDCWRNNLMFKYKDNETELEDVKIVDQQMWTINSPAFDLLHAIHSNAGSQEVFDNLEYYLDYYHSSLCEILVEMGGDPKELFPREGLFRQWKKYAPYGLLLGMLVTRGLLGGPECMPNLVEHVRANRPLEEVFAFSLPDEREYCQRVKVMVRHVIKNKLI